MKAITIFEARERALTRYKQLLQWRMTNTADIEDKAIEHRRKQAVKFTNYIIFHLETGDLAKKSLQNREWIQKPGKPDGIRYCPDCKAYEYDGHNLGCPCKRALR